MTSISARTAGSGGTGVAVGVWLGVGVTVGVDEAVGVIVGVQVGGKPTAAPLLARAMTVAACWVEATARC